MATIVRRGYCRYEFLGQIPTGSGNQPWPEPTDVADQKYIDLTIDYNWTKNNNNNGVFTINSISWRSNENMQTGGKFAQAGKITVFCPSYSSNSGKLSGNSNSYTLNSGSITTKTITSNDQYITISFEYSYTDADNVRYFVNIKNIKVYSYSKYENNIVFTKDGFKEFATTVKKYPIIHIAATTAGEWTSTSGQPNIKVFYGDPAIGTTTAYSRNGVSITASYRYIPVGSNINFDVNYNSATIVTTTATSQNSGTFRIKINNDTHEVPIKGFGSTASNQSITMSTTHSSGITIRAKSGSALNSITLDGNTNISGTLSVTGTTTLKGNANVGGNLSVTGTTTLYNTLTLGSSNTSQNIVPGKNEEGTLGTGSKLWNTIFVKNIGSSSTAVTNAYITNLTTSAVTASAVTASTITATTLHIGDITIGGNSGGTGSATDAFLGKTGWTNQLANSLEFGSVSGTTFTLKVKISNNDNDGIKQGADGNNGFSSTYTGSYVGDTTASIYTKGGIYAAKNIWATRVFNAVFNDYAECRTTIDLTPGHVVVDQDDGSLVCSSKRLQSGAQVISDTYGHLMGQTENATTPIAVAGRVLVYTYQPRENYHAGMAVCSAPDGTVDIMSRAEICEYPDCIVGIVSEIPDYEIWGSDNVKVDGRIWIKVR